MADLNFETLRVLTVVDDPFLIKTLRAQLEASGIEQIAFVTQPVDTFETLTAWRPSLMVCDHRLEPVTGLGLIREIRSEVLAGELWTLDVDAILDTPVSVPRLRDSIASLHQPILNQMATNGSPA